jgi:biotin carboxyl carrier protein
MVQNNNPVTSQLSGRFLRKMKLFVETGGTLKQNQKYMSPQLKEQEKGMFY